MFFTAIAKDAPTFGKGKLISKDRYEQFGGVSIFFYDEESIRNEFGEYGVFEVIKVVENYPFHLIKCQKISADGASTLDADAAKDLAR